MDWLPELILLEHHDGAWEPFIEAVYRAYCDDWVFGPRAYFSGQVIRCRQSPSYVGKEYAFWHLTSRDEEGDRVPDLRRCERVRWPRAIMTMTSSDDVRVWESSRPGNMRFLIALKDFSYVIVLGSRNGYYLLVTAYHVEHEHRRKKLAKEYSNSQPKN